MLSKKSAKISTMTIHKPSLDDVFLSLTDDSTKGVK